MTDDAPIEETTRRTVGRAAPRRTWREPTGATGGGSGKRRGQMREPAPLPQLEAHAYTDGASGGSRGPGGYGAVMTWKGRTEEISGSEQNTTNLRMEVTAACVALETIDDGYIVTVYSDSSYLDDCMRRGWYKRWRENGCVNHLSEPAGNRHLSERVR